MRNRRVIRKVINISKISLKIFLILSVIILIKLLVFDKGFKELVYKTEIVKSKPEFYGTIGINLKVGDKLDLTNSVFRIYAKDFYDGDLTQDIIVLENTVNTKEEGNYYIKYFVKNSLGNVAEIETPVIISNDQERTVKRKLYEAEDTWHIDMIDSKRGNYQDRQNLGIYAKAGASIKVREVNNYVTTQIVGEFLNNNQNTEKEFNITSEWTTITPEVNSVPFIKSSNIDSRVTYQKFDDIEYKIREIETFSQQNDNTIFFANVFERKNINEEIEEIKIPVYNCDKAEIYINTTGDGVNSDGYKLVRTLNNPSNGYANVRFLEPIKIKSDKFVIAVKYTGEWVPINYGTNPYTYFSSELNSKWKLSTQIALSDGFLNVAPIICKSKYRFENALPVIEINIEDIFKENSLIKPLDYYVYGDDEEKFFKEWNKSKNSYAVLENDRITFLTPISDKDKILKNSNGTDSYNYNSITDIFKMYDNIFKMYDNFLGLEDKAEKKINQNVKTKYFVKADYGYSKKNVVGYYSNDKYTAQVGKSITSFFYKNWLPLHELAHGYEGTLDGGNLNGNNINLSEVANNIFAYYYQKTYLIENDYGWMGSISSQEKNWNKIRKKFDENFKFNQIPDESYSGTDHYHLRLYMMVNLLEKLGPQNVMQAYYIKARKDRLNGGNTSNVDLLAQSIFDELGYNIIPYLESWNIEVSENIKSEIESQNATLVYYLRELVNSDFIATRIGNDLGLEGIYSLVSNEDVSKYNLTGSTTIKLTNEEYDKFRGKKVILKSGKNIIREEWITSTNIEFNNVPIGIYDIKISNTTDNIGKKYLIIQQEEDNISPELSKLEVMSPSTGEYVANQEIILKAIFNEEIIIKGDCPLPILNFGDNQAKGTISVLNTGINEITWKYIIACEDKGDLKVVYIDFSNISDISENIMLSIENPLLTGYEITAKGHMEESLPSQEPTCTQTGLTEGTICSLCGEVLKACEIIPAEHKIVKHEGKEATCIENGWEEYETCENCDYTTYEEIAKIAHDYGEWIVDKQATEQEKGHKYRVCTMCEVEKEEELIPKVVADEIEVPVQD